MWDEKGRNHLKGFPQNIAEVFRALQTPVKRILEKITVVT